MALIEQSDLEAKLGRSLTTEEASDFTVVNAALQAYVERIIGSSVEEATESSRYYDGGVQHLSIDPCTDITNVYLVDDTDAISETAEVTEYTAEPRNRALKTMLRTRLGVHPYGYNAIRVDAKFSTFGDDDVTAMIKSAMLDALSKEIQDTSTASGEVKKESIEGYSVEYATNSTVSNESMASINSTLSFLFPGIA